MDTTWLLSLVLGSSCSALAAGAFMRARVRSPLLRQISALDGELSRERAVMRRRLHDVERERNSTEARMHAALGLPAAGAIKQQIGRRFAQRLVERVAGLTDVDAATVADEAGLAWVPEAGPDQAALAAAAGGVLQIAQRLQVECRQVHVELADARHLVVRPVPGTFPRLALATSTTSRPTSAFALDATLAFAAISNGAAAAISDADPTDPFAGHDSRPGEDIKGQVAQNLESELQSARTMCGARALVVAIGDEPLAAAVINGPDREAIGSLIRALRPLLASVERRCRAPGRRIELTCTAGSCVTFAPLGTAGRFGLLTVGADGPTDPTVVDRMVGRLRRFLPPPTPLELSPRGVV